MIIATAGHVDHGKTTLIKLLTGVDTDRLPEEKKRNLSIDLGFAYLGHPELDNCTLGFVDVPGHEKFVRNMITGVSAIDVALLVVAANDGPMPQTREHLAILQLLGIKRIIVVLSKVDLADASQRQLAETRLAELLQESVYSEVPVVPVAATQPDTIDALRKRLFDLAAMVPDKKPAGYFRLTVDRSFSVTGAGTVVTGSVLSGSVAEEESLRLLPGNARLRVRQIRAQSEQATQAMIGQRCALNLAGSALRNRMPARGDLLTDNPLLEVSTVFDCKLQCAPAFNTTLTRSGVVSHWMPGHLHVASETTPCRIALLELEQLQASDTGLARVYCDKPVAVVAGDRFVLRCQSAQFTVAGGEILDPYPPRRGRSRQPRLQMLHSLQSLQPLDALQSLLAISTDGVDLNQFSAGFNCTINELSEWCQSLQVVQCQLASQWWGVAPEQWKQIQNSLVVALAHWHQQHPLLLGATTEQLCRQPSTPRVQAVVHHALARLIETNNIQRQGAVYRTATWSVTLSGELEALWQRVEVCLQTAGSIPPRVVELAEEFGVSVEEIRRDLNTFVAHGRLYRVSVNRYYLPATLLTLAQVGSELGNQNNFSVATFRDEAGIGRNLVIELLEFFDRCRFTRRVGELRQVLQSPEAVFGSR